MPISTSLPFMEVKPVTFNPIVEMVVIAPVATFMGPATFNVPVAVPDKTDPLFNVKPPRPTFVIAVALVQLAVPFTVSDKQFAGAPFIVTVLPEQIITLSAAVGIAADTAPAQETVDHVDGVFQLPLIRE